ncbi:MAG: tRNA lysidine(34) synthetase TilS [Planctomycetes bacterium]|nr:tRNA lysidine(34) synthetase TilS [Planctomycetota bacterium]
MTTSLVARLLERHLLSPGDRIVAGVSGGSDSVALLGLLSAAASAQGWQLHVGHLEHGLRGEEGRADAAFVEDLAKKLGVPCRVERADVAALAAELGEGLESAGRQARYQFLARFAEEVGATKVAVAHTMDDQAETVLLRIFRGAGLRGLRGILPSRPVLGGSPVLLVRPLLGARREELADWLARQGLEHREDASNEDPRFMRNRVRAEALPGLKRIFGRDPAPGLARIADTACLAWDAAEARAREFWDGAAADPSGDLVAEEARLRQVPEAFRIAVWMEGIRRLKGNLGGIAAGHYDRLEKASAQPGPFRLDLPAQVRIEWEHGRFRLRRGPREESPAQEAVPLAVPGRANLEGMRLSVTAEVREAGLSNLAGSFPLKGPHEEYVDADRVRGRLVVRPRRSGDRFQPLGAPGHKNVKKYLINRKVPRSERANCLLVADDEGPVWVLGHAIAERVKLTGETRRVVRFEILRWD